MHKMTSCMILFSQECAHKTKIILTVLVGDYTDNIELS